MHGPSYIMKRVKLSLEIRTPPLVTTLEPIPRVPGIEGFHYTHINSQG